VGSGHAAGISAMRNTYKILVLIPARVLRIGIQSTRKDNIKMEKISVMN
jgi:hypothetical protein